MTYRIGSYVLVGLLVAALWQSGILTGTVTAWASIGILIVLGVRVMIALANSVSDENFVDRT